MPGAGSAAFVGREREVRILTSALANARSGKGGLIALTGEAGIGKTRLAEEATSLAQGFATAWGAAWPDAGAPPLWPWHDLLAQLGTADADELLTLREPGDAERFVRFRAVAAELTRLAAQRPVLLVLDDVHAVDPAAALLTRFTVRTLRRAPILLVVTCRDVPAGGPGADAVRALLGEGIRIELPGLDDRAVVDLLAEDGGAMDAAALVDLTGGNPLLLREAITAGAGADLSSIPDRIRELLLRRLAIVPPRRREVLAAAAVLGPSADDAMVAALAGVEPEVVRTVREVARSVGFIRRHEERHFVFAHALLREALLDERGAVPVARLHAQAAILVAATGARDRIERTGRVAQHLLAAARHGEASIDAAVAAAREASRAEHERGAHEPAARTLRAALDLLEDARIPPAAALWLELAQAELAGGRLAAARVAFLATLQDERADPSTVATAAIGLGGIWVFEHRDVEGIDRFLGILEHAIAGLGTQRPDLAARLRARLAAERVYLGTGAADEVREQVAVLRELDDTRGLAETLSLLHHVLLGPQDGPERTAIAAEMVAAAARTGDTVLVLMGALWSTVDRFLAGTPDAERSLAELRQRADALRVEAVLYIVELMDVMLALRAGRFAEAEIAARRCFFTGRELGDADAVGYYGAQLLAIRWLQGRSEEMLPVAREIAASPTLVAAHRIFPAGLAALAADAGGAATEEARRHLDALVSAGIAGVAPSSNWLLTMFCIVEAADRLGDPAAAAAGYDALLPYAGLPVMASLAVVCFGSVDRVLGIAARVCGRLDDAVTHLENAIEVDRRLGNRPILALSRGDLGATLMRRRGGADVPRGTALLQLAASALEGMGLTAQAERYRTISPGPAPRPATLTLATGTWQISAGGEHGAVPDGVGMRYLARLLAAPRREFGADELSGATVPDPSRQEILDDVARREYRRRVDALRAELDAADAAGDPDRAGRAQTELDQLVEQLAAQAGLGGRARTFADGRERARTAVQKAIRRAIARIRESAPSLGAGLAASIQTGLVCRFDPIADVPDAWTIEGL